MAPLAQSSPITTISFDGDGTLWDFDKVMRHALHHTLDELRRQAPGDQSERLSIEEMIRIRDAVALELRGEVVSHEQIRLMAFQRTLRQMDMEDDDLARRLNAVYFKHRFEDIELYPDVIPMLDVLSPRFDIGLLSNGNNYPERCGLAGRFAFVVFSQDCGHEKPGRRFFEIALESAGCSAHQLLHVGDSLVSDVLGAKNAGIRSVWLNRARIHNDTGIKPDFQITTLEDLAFVCAIRVWDKHLRSAKRDPAGGQ